MNTCAPVSAANDEARPERCARARRNPCLAEMNRQHVLRRKTLDTRKTLDKSRHSFFRIFPDSWSPPLRNSEELSAVYNVFDAPFIAGGVSGRRASLSSGAVASSPPHSRPQGRGRRRERSFASVGPARVCCARTAMGLAVASLSGRPAVSARAKGSGCLRLPHAGIARATGIARPTLLGQCRQSLERLCGFQLRLLHLGVERPCGVPSELPRARSVVIGYFHCEVKRPGTRKWLR